MCVGCLPHVLFDAAADLRRPPTTFIAYQTRPMDNENGVAPFAPGFPHHLGLAACEIWRRIIWSKAISAADQSDAGPNQCSRLLFS